MRIQNSNNEINNTIAPSTRQVVQRAQNRVRQAGDGFGRTSSAQLLKSLRGAKNQADPASSEGQIQALFKEQFAQKAADQKEFHAFMKEVFGDQYDFSKAEAFRRSALAGDFGWLPPVKFATDAELGGANGAYAAESGVVYINEKLKNNIPLAAQTFVEEAGHHLDAKLNTSDTVGDEGELFRRLLNNESLSAAQINAIKTENDKGTIVVDGKEIEVEFWNPFKAIKKAVKKVGKAIGNAAKSVGKAIGSVAKGVGSVVVGAVKGTVDGVGGFFGNLFQGKVGDAFTSLWKGFDKGFLQAPSKLSNAVFNAADYLVDAAANLAEPIGLDGIVKSIGSRAVDIGRNITNTGLAIIRDVITTPVEAAGGFLQDHYEGFKALFKGDFGEAFKHFGMAYVNATGRIVGGAVDVTLRAVACAASAIGTALFLEPPSRPLSADEKAWFKEVYGDSVDLDLVRVKRGGLVTVGASKAVGNTIYLADKYFDSNGNLTSAGKRTLAHEMGHIWQNQNGGGDYIHKALFAMAKAAIETGSRNDAYDWRAGMLEGKSFQELNPEQQATVIEDIAVAMRNGNFDSTLFNAQELAYLKAALAEVRAGNVG